MKNTNYFSYREYRILTLIKGDFEWNEFPSISSNYLARHCKRKFRYLQAKKMIIDEIGGFSDFVEK